MTRDPLRIADRWFEKRSLGNGLTFLTEPFVHPFIRCNIWHLRGRDRDLLIDSGLGLVSLKEAERELFDRPVEAVATHTHFDHTGGLHEFDRISVHESEADLLAEAADGMALSAEALGEEFVTLMEQAGYRMPDGSFLSALPHEDFVAEAQELKPATATRKLVEGDVVDIGDRHFDVLHLPGHSPGSIGLFEQETGILFSGDAIYDGPLLDNLPESSISDYRETMLKLLRLPVSVVHAGHDPSFDRERLQEIARSYLLKWG